MTVSAAAIGLDAQYARLVEASGGVPEAALAVDDRLAHVRNGTADVRDVLHIEWESPEVASHVIARAALATLRLLQTELIETAAPLHEDIVYWNRVRSADLRVIIASISEAPFRYARAARQAVRDRTYRPILPLWPGLAHARQSFSEHVQAIKRVREVHADAIGALSAVALPVSDDVDLSKVASILALVSIAMIEYAESFEWTRAVSETGEEARVRMLEAAAAGMSSTAAHDATVAQLLAVLERVDEHRWLIRRQRLYGHLTPRRLQRFWLVGVIGGVAAYNSASFIFGRRMDILDMLMSASDTVASFLNQWVYEPLQNVFATMRYREESLATMRRDSLRADLESLERMVKDYVRDTAPLADENATMYAAVKGDLSIINNQYEANLRTPFRSVLFGDMARVMLIQIQKTKVDIETAMASLDRLLKANELNFALLAVGPAILLVGAAALGVRRIVRAQSGTLLRQVHERLRGTLRAVERHLNGVDPAAPEFPVRYQGFLVMEMILLRTNANLLPPIQRDTFLDDLHDLEQAAFSVAQRLNTVTRMHRTYAFLKPE